MASRAERRRRAKARKAPAGKVYLHVAIDEALKLRIEAAAQKKRRTLTAHVEATLERVFPLVVEHKVPGLTSGADLGAMHSDAEE